MTLTQTVDILPDRRVRFDFEVPHEIPEGRTNVIIQFPANENVSLEVSAESAVANKKIGMTGKELDEFLKNAYTPISDSLTGILSHLDNITIEQIREERLTKHL